MVLITGNTGYIGTVMTSYLLQHSFRVVGLDSNYYEGCNFFTPEDLPFKQIIKDIRDINEKDLEGITAIIHLAALSNDPLGELNPALTYEINHLSSIKLAGLAKKVGIKRFIFSSSCSTYGISPDDSPLVEEGVLNPITEYAKTKVNVEKAISQLADNNFYPVFMRNATVYGLSPALRLDLVVNNLVAWAYLTGKVAIMSDGTPWRPIIHVEDLCNAFMAVLEAPIEKIQDQTFNVGINEENYQVRDIADKIQNIVPGCRVEIQNKTGSDERTYRVDFTKFKNRFAGFKPKWNVKKGIEELYQAYKDFGLTLNDFNAHKYFRVRRIRYLLENDQLNSDLRWTKAGENL